MRLAAPAALALSMLLACEGPPDAAARAPALGDAPLRARSERGCYAVELRAEPPRPGVGELFAIETRVRDGSRDEPARDVRVALDAAMPQHGHGMTTRPETTLLAPGRYRTAGMRLHMPGTWELAVRIEGACDDVARIAIEQPPAHGPPR